LFPNRLSPSRKSKLLIASVLSTDGDSDRCFATFFIIKVIQLPSVQIDCVSEVTVRPEPTVAGRREKQGACSKAHSQPN
ncbi:MAG: hypothetical protein ACI3ZB_07595, partial [Prevotella sp.]